MRHIALAVVLALNTVPASIIAATQDTATKASQPAGLQPVTTAEGVTEYRLPNGLRVLLAPDASKPTTTVNVTYLVGSRHENYGETGMAHLLEHLLFKGTPKHPNIDVEFTRRGMMSNGTTWYDRTNYYETFAANDADLDWALKMEADRMINSFIARKDLDSEMTVVRNEMESGENDPFSILWQKMSATAYQWHNYGKDTIGARADVENVSIPRLQAFYHKYYQPDNAILVVSGKFDAAKTLAMIQRHFGPVKKPSRVIEPTYTREPVQDGEREVVLRRAGDVQIVAALYHAPDGGHADSPAFQMLMQIVGDTPNGRLHKALVEKKLASEAFGLGMSMNEPGYGIAGAKLRTDGDREQVKRVMLDVLENIAKQPITEAELDQARSKWMNGFDKLMSDPEQLGTALSETIAMGDWRLLFLNRDRIEKLTVADVQRVAEQYLKQTNRTLGQFIPDAQPQRAVIPPKADLKLAFKDFKARPAVAQGEAFDPTPANIEARTQRSALPNGLQLALLPKKTRAESVAVTFNLHFGDEQSLKGQREAGALLAAVLTRGTRSLSREQLHAEFDKLKTIWAYQGNAEGGVLTMQTNRSNLPAALKLAQSVLREPALDATEFDRAKHELAAALEEQRSDPNAVARNTLKRQFNRYDPTDVRYQPSFEETLADVNKLQLPQIQQFYQRFYGGSHSQLAIVGDFDAAAVREQVATLFGDWRSTERYQQVLRKFDPIQPKELTMQLKDKANAVFSAALPIKMVNADVDYPALLVGNYVLGQGSGLSSRLINRLRQQDGISYGAGSSLKVDAADDASTLQVKAIYAPENLPKLKAGVSEELARLVKDGITEKELQDAKAGLLQNFKLERAQDPALAAELASLMDDGRTMQFVAELETKVAKLTLADVNAVIRKYIDPAKFVKVYAGEFKQ
ncbi:zinc protease [Chitinivorax tropicus]|uniref:Zinc protease n=1 Tax=Chitinivorax tropicus TaxID=714531 RepID=A0A840MTW0_9PROT|nr:pitrilysin family protein [Chitinivorax tropicus]MBB5020232.1 zinc protease [Chitinivorax tropicus]